MFRRSSNLRGEDPRCFCEMDPMVFPDRKMMKNWILGEFFEKSIL